MTKPALTKNISLAKDANPNMNVQEMIHTLCVDARAAYAVLAAASNEQKDIALVEAAMAIRAQALEIISANAADVADAKAAGLEPAMIDRLTLNEKRIEAVAAGLETIATLPDPVNKVIDSWERPNGLAIQRVSIPIGVIGMIYESRPNVTADAAGLCLKSGNAVILRGGSESLRSSAAIAHAIHQGLAKAGLPQACVQLVATRDRAAVGEMLTAFGSIDLIIPRGGKGLCERVQKESRVPTLLHLDGNCHVYVHASADLDMAKEVLINAKMRRTGICGAAESLLVDIDHAATMLPQLVRALLDAGCEVRGDAMTHQLDPRVKHATEADWGTEYLAPIISVKTVEGLEQAIAHVNAYGSHHTDSIIAEDHAAARKFLREVDSAIVLHNASTQFADGGEFGFGAEIGIATGRLHARGPVGAEQLTTYKYVVHGSGQVRAG